MSQARSAGGLPIIPPKSNLRYSKNSIEVLEPPSRHLSVQSRPSISDDPFGPVKSSPNDEITEADGYEERLRRPLSAYSQSARSYISTLSLRNRKNFARFGCSKILFLVANTLLTFLGIFAGLLGLFTLLDLYTEAALVRLVRMDVLFLATVTGAVATCVGLVGFTGAFLHRKKVVSIHGLLLWPVVAGLVVTGYMAYNQLNNHTWDDYLSDKWNGYQNDRAYVQDQYNCCGYFSALDRPLYAGHCALSTTQTIIPTTPIARSLPPPPPPPSPPLRVARGSRTAHRRRQTTNSTTTATTNSTGSIDPAATDGCYLPWDSFSTSYLRGMYICAFACIPLVLFVFVVGLLAANHIYD
ncbi:hypothetical protein HKX48_000493 [Thoreauomyces humboldtii]|nr:hypothetical protein HKX48_000493 [Thoreauomyces humboldtii]